MSDQTHVTEHIQTEMSGSAGFLTINRPESHNAMTRAMWDGLVPALHELQNWGAHVVVIKGTGSTFCAGADLNELMQINDDESANAQWFSIKYALDELKAFALPTVAMINGACMGGGCLLAMACDLRYSVKAARFSIPISKLGIVLDDANILRLISLVGPAVASEMLYTGVSISATEAEMVGLINRALDPEDLPLYVNEICNSIYENGRASIFEAKCSIARILSHAHPENALASFDDQQRVIESYLSADFQERIRRRL
ncbi:MAG TPA: enoyl-CoA hydratase/isomerase family protein [Candidatus Melainabacteria bacterium]|jgi:enoyl-CoA hydratase|nr:enoyl-CoA hydratase/isomerase family protein [Candidatus Melainabacteria bacterium]HIN67410.1 enoyl-CoA hydratase/isomerase family protein [Candidatus Obscuribacterales bacterium]